MKTYSVFYTPSAQRDIQRLPKDILNLFVNAVKRLASNPYTGKRLHGPLRGLCSYRTGDYRIIYEIQEKQIRIIVIAVGHRREIYEIVRRRLS